MVKRLVPLAAVLLACPSLAADAEPQGAPSPNEIVAQAAPDEWVTIPSSDLLVMTLAPDGAGKPRSVVIQLMPPPFSQPWIANIRTLAKAHWWDGLAITRVQDNYVVQWGDPNGEDATKARALPDGLLATNEKDYLTESHITISEPPGSEPSLRRSVDVLRPPFVWTARDAYAPQTDFRDGWPIGMDERASWPVHCYGMVGVGRNYSPDAGTGAELYTVIGQAPRHLDRNIALVGRVIEGIENLSSLPRGTGPLGFYDKPEQQVPILSIRLASDVPSSEQPHFEYLDTASRSFEQYVQARANRRDPFFIVPAKGVDICNAPVPVRRRPDGGGK